MRKFILNGQLKLLMEFILCEWATAMSEIIIAIFRKSVTSGNQDLNRIPAVPVELPSGPYRNIGGYHTQCYFLKCARGKSCFLNFA